MESSINYRSIPANVPVMCIPRVFSNIGEQRIKHIIQDLRLGPVEKIDIINKQSTDGAKFNCVFIHLKYWAKSEQAYEARERLLQGKEIKIVYDEPWFWKVSAYRTQQSNSTNTHRRENSRHQRKQPMLIMSDDERNERRDERRDERRHERRDELRDERRERPRYNTKYNGRRTGPRNRENYQPKEERRVYKPKNTVELSLTQEEIKELTPLNHTSSTHSPQEVERQEEEVYDDEEENFRRSYSEIKDKEMQDKYEETCNSLTEPLVLEFRPKVVKNNKKLVVEP